VRGLAAGAASQDRVASPTFTLNRIYKAPKFDIHHYDFYRLNEPGIVADQLAESLDNPRAVTVVEWSDIVQDVLPPEHLIIEFKPTPAASDEREVAVTYPEALAPLVEKLENDWSSR